jgi:hypothetical protein
MPTTSAALSSSASSFRLGLHPPAASHGKSQSDDTPGVKLNPHLEAVCLLPTFRQAPGTFVICFANTR